jgi:magnesium transporter
MTAHARHPEYGERMDREESSPWEQLTRLVERADRVAVSECLEALPREERARTVSRLADETQAALLRLLGPEEAAGLLEQLSATQAGDLLEELEPGEAAAIVDELPSDEQADLLAELRRDEADAILAKMVPREASDARRLLQYPPHVAGGLMITEFLVFPVSASVDDVLKDLREHAGEYSDYEIQYVYISGEGGRLVGVLRLRDLLLARPHTRAEEIMLREPLHLPIMAPLERLEAFFAEHPFIGVPITDEGGVLRGVLRRVAVEEAIGERETSAFLAVSGLAGEEELRTMPLGVRTGRRLSWLSINIVLNLCAASVIALYQDTLASVIALAVFLPIISDMSGCSGNQAVAVSIRELSLGLVRPGELARVVWKEGAVGIANGLALGLLLGTVAVLWKGNVYLGLVVGGALMLSTLLAVVLGGLIPLALKGIKQDPALASGPILTTLTDMFGFFLVLSFATALLGRLT